MNKASKSLKQARILLLFHEIGAPAIRIVPTALKLLESGAAVVVLPVSV